jgi:hypothetical protein
MLIVENSMVISQEQEVNLPYDPPFPLWGMYSNEIKSMHQGDICMPMFIAPPFRIAQTN